MGTVLNNLGWKFMERVLTQLVQFVVSIVLARLLLPSDYGLVAMVTIFVALANVLIDGGFGSALIQKKEIDDIDYSTIFYFSVGFSLLLYAVLYISAPAISQFYGVEYQILTPVLRVLGVQIIIFAMNSVLQAYAQRQMMFKSLFRATLVGTIVSAVVGLSMAFSGCGVWAIVGQQLSSSGVNTLILYVVIRKRPILAFSLSRLRVLFDYGMKLLGSELLITGHQHFVAFVIGKLYTPQDLAFFDRAKQIPSLIVSNINSSVGAVLFPKMSREQDSMAYVKDLTRASIRCCSYVMTPIVLGLIAISEPLVELVLTEKWMGCVPMMNLFCIVFLLMPIHTANMQALKAIGRSDILLKLELIKKAIELVLFIAVFWISVEAIVVNMAMLATLFTAINAYPNRTLLGYSYKEQALDLFPAVFMSVIMLVVIQVFNKLIALSGLEMILANMLIGGGVYIALSILMKNREFKYILQILFR